jgi:hypothetical protein
MCGKMALSGDSVIFETLNDTFFASLWSAVTCYSPFTPVKAIQENKMKTSKFAYTTERSGF